MTTQMTAVPEVRQAVWKDPLPAVDANRPDRPKALREKVRISDYIAQGVAGPPFDARNLGVVAICTFSPNVVLGK